MIRGWAQSDWDRAWTWVQSGIQDGSLLIADDRMNLAESIGTFLSDQVIENLGLHAGIDVFVEFQNVSLSNDGYQGGLHALIAHLVSDEDSRYMIDIVPGLSSPAARVGLQDGVIAKWSRRFPESAKKWVSSLEYPAERARLALDLAFPYASHDETSPDYRALSKWWESLGSSRDRTTRHEAKRKVVSRWLRHDPKGAADWLLKTYPDPNEFGGIVLSRMTNHRDSSPEPHGDWYSESVRLVERWKASYPDKYRSQLENSRLNGRHQSEVLARLDAIEEAVN